LGLRTDDNAGFFRDVEMYRDDQVWVFAQTVTPDSTLCLHSWLAELGDTALDETLDGLSDFERSADEYAWLPSDDQLTARAMREAQVKPAGLWARHSRVALRGAPLLMQGVFLPAMGHP
jgi:chorismate-pyruvate lyase